MTAMIGPMKAHCACFSLENQQLKFKILNVDIWKKFPLFTTGKK